MHRNDLYGSLFAHQSIHRACQKIVNKGDLIAQKWFDLFLLFQMICCPVKWRESLRGKALLEIPQTQRFHQHVMNVLRSLQKF